MRLRLNSQRTGSAVGWIQRDGDTVSFSDDDTRKLFTAYRHAGGWTTPETFDALATGWSNGYVTIPALTDS